MLTLYGPRYTCTSEAWFGVVTNALLMNFGHPCGWFTVQHLRVSGMSSGAPVSGISSKSFRNGTASELLHLCLGAERRKPNQLWHLRIVRLQAENVRIWSISHWSSGFHPELYGSKGLTRHWGKGSCRSTG